MNTNTVNIITNLNNTWGLSKDVKIIKSILEKHGYRITLGQWDKTPTGPKAFINLHLELMGGRWFNHAARNVLIPNQEWFPPDWTQRAILRFNAVFTKTNHATKIFTNLGFHDVVYTGFTSLDCYRPNTERDDNCFHIAGNSLFKNTHFILENWQSNWPDLYVYGSNPEFQKMFVNFGQNNIHTYFGYLPDNAILRVLNSHKFAIQLSRSEGFGHCIVEPLSTNTITVTLDAPPMNEFSAVYKLPANRAGGQCYGEFYDPISLDSLNDLFINPVSRNERDWWLKNNAQFEQRFMEAIKKL